MKQSTQTLRIITVVFAASAVVSCADETSEEADSLPPDDIRLIVPYGAGGPTDVTARQTGEALQEVLDDNNNIVVENAPGGGGVPAMSTFADDGTDDGTELAMLVSPSFLIPVASGEADYVLEDFTPIGLISDQPIVILESPDRESDLLDIAENERAIIATNGPETSAGIDITRLAENEDLQLTQIPHDGNAEMLNALMGGDVPATIANASPDVLQGIEDGLYDATVVFSEERLDYLSDVPTMQELGYETEMLATSQFGIVAPSDIQDGPLRDLEEALEEVLGRDEVRDAIGEEYMTESFQGSNQWGEQLEAVISEYDAFFQ